MAANFGESRRWVAFIALASGSIGMLISVGGAGISFANQIQMTGTSIWPLPALALIDWAALGLLGFFGVCFGIKPSPSNWPLAAWFVVGALLPLIILGAFSIGTLVLISLPFFIVPAFFITFRKVMMLPYGLGLILLGAVCNLVLIFIFIVMGASAF